MINIKSEKIKYLIIILLILLFFLSINSYFDFKTLNKSGEEGYYFPMYEFVRQSVYNGEFPHWITYYYAGMPFYANAQNQFFKLFTLVSLVTPGSFEANIKIEVILMMLIASISMYFLMLELKVKPRFALLGVIVFMFNPFPLRRIVYGAGDEFINAYIWIPLIFFLTLKFVRSRNYKEGALYSIFAGVALALQFHGGYPAIFVYTAFLLSCFLLVYLILNLFSVKLIKKVVFCGLIMGVVFFGLGAIKLLPLLEFSKVSSLSASRTFEDAKGSYFEISGVRDVAKPVMFLVTKKTEAESYDKIAIGIIPFIFLLFSLSKFRNKYVISSFILIIVLFLVGSGSWLFYVLWKFFPGFNRQHHIGRILTMIILPASILVSIGAQSFFEKVSKKVRMNKWVLNIIYAAMIIVILVNLNFFNGRQHYGITSKFDLDDVVKQNELFQFFSSDKDIFRVHNVDDTSIGGRAVLFAAMLKQEIIMGAFNVWIPEYLNEYVWGYSRFAPYKFLGMLNTKYVYSDEELEDPELEFVKEFGECEPCTEVLGKEESNDGPYLYLNKMYLPRADMADEAILVIGNYDEAKKTMYALMMNNNFNPASTVIVMKEGLVNDYDIDFLKRFKAVVLVTGSIDQNSGNILEEYKESGGVLLPDVIEGENSVTEEDIGAVLVSKKDYKDAEKVDIIEYSQNKREIKVEEGFLVLSEKFFMFDDWKVRLDGESREILRANGINSAVYIDKAGELVLEYESRSFRNGLMVSIITLMVVIGYIVFYYWKRK